MMTTSQAHRSRAILLAILLSAALSAAPLPAGTLEVNAGAALDGSMGLEVTLGGPCWPNTVPVGGPTASGVYIGCVYVEAGAATVDGTTIFKAGRRITLGEGFSVAPGVDFQAVIDESLDPFAFVVDRSPSDLATYGATFQIDLDNLALDSLDELYHLVGVAGDGTELFRVVLLHNETMNENRLALHARLDSGGYAETTVGQQVVVPAGANAIEVSWKADDGAGHLMVSVGGAPFFGLTGLDNGDGRVETVNWGAVWGQVADSTGSFDLDGYSSIQ